MGILDRNLIGNSTSAYFIGIGGVGMSALARVLKVRGLEVSGSDARASATTRALAESGIRVTIGQERPSFAESDLIIYSSAIRDVHPELAAARKAGNKICHRAEILSSLFNQAKTSIGVTGTHGKTTTSSMISSALSELGQNPTCLVGGEMLNFGTNTRLGNPDLWVSEVDESDKTHELYAPNYSVVTNLEEDHMENYRDLEDLKNSFERYLSNARNPGLVVYSADDPVLRALVPRSGRPHRTFGFSQGAEVTAENIQMTAFGSEFDILEDGFFSSRAKLSVPGLHNISNALAAFTILTQLGLEAGAVAGALARFRGAGRRLEIKWQSEDLVVIDDYAHHPTEVRASLRALRGMGRRVLVIFQPHRFSRTQYFYREFGRAFEEADELILTEIYGAGETNPEGVAAKRIYEAVLETGRPSVQMIAKDDVISHLLGRRDLAGIIAFIGAGDIGDIADEFANRFKSPATA